jgi:hypothetical protein
MEMKMNTIKTLMVAIAMVAAVVPAQAGADPYNFVCENSAGTRDRVWLTVDVAKNTVSQTAEGGALTEFSLIGKKMFDRATRNVFGHDALMPSIFEADFEYRALIYVRPGYYQYIGPRPNNGPPTWRYACFEVIAKVPR